MYKRQVQTLDALKNLGFKEATRSGCSIGIVDMVVPVSYTHLLRGLKKEDIERGQVSIKPGTVKPHKNFKAEVYVLTKEEGGRHTPFFNNYRPQCYFRTTDVTGCCTLPEGVEMVRPGDNVNREVQLSTPIAMEKAMRFAIREGGRTVGAVSYTHLDVYKRQDPTWATSTMSK